MSAHEPEGEDTDSLGTCMGCGHRIQHDARAVRAGFVFNTHGAAMNDRAIQNGLYHHSCLRDKLATPHLPREIERVWGDYGDFQAGGLPYMAFIIGEDMAEMREAGWDEDTAANELADIVINAMRMLDEMGHDPERMVGARLYEHQVKGQEHIIEKYTDRYVENGGETTDDVLEYREQR